MLIQFAVAWLTLNGASLVDAAYPVTGVFVDSRNGGVPLRQEINTLQAAGGAQWDLYIRALRAMYEADPDDPLSFFQVAGIHGRPYMEWNGAGAMTSDGWRGYCPHGVSSSAKNGINMQLLIHREGEAILALASSICTTLRGQILVEHAKRLALEYPQRYRYQYIHAAETLRAPYWDWAYSSAVPPVTISETLRIRVPNNNILEEVELQNPLFTYKYPQAAVDKHYGPFDTQNRTQTLRCLSPDSYPASANDRIVRRKYKQWVYDAFTHSTTFSEFASIGDDGTSLEQIHNGIHWDGACGQQFLSADLSAFEPLFMLHHTQMDRLWAYWQAMKPDEAIFNDSYTGRARFSTLTGTSITPESPLAPFFASEGNFHTTDSVRSIQSLGYAYQGLEYWEKSPEQMRQEATRLINRMYSGNDTASSRLMRRGVPTTRYFARVQLEVSEVKRPCSVNLYVDGQRVGSMVVMQQPVSGVIYGEFSLDDATESKMLKGVTPDKVVSSVESGLEVEIIKIDGTGISVDSVPSLKIQLEHVPVTPPASEDELPSYGSPRRRPALAVEKTRLEVP
ncbi:Fc.00g060730.m01.CDS01 [Cosmosporella sp. VM-42]